MSDTYKSALGMINEGTGVVTMDGGSCVVIDRDGRVVVVRS